MNRRAFLTTLGVAGLGVVLLPEIIFSAPPPSVEDKLRAMAEHYGVFLSRYYNPLWVDRSPGPTLEQLQAFQRLIEQNSVPIGTIQ